MKTLENTNLLSGLNNLSIKKRASLAHALIQSLDTVIDNDVEHSWDIEVQKRIKKFNQGKSKDFPAFQTLDQLKQKHTK